MNPFFDQPAEGLPPEEEHTRIVDPRTEREIRHERVMDAFRWRARTLAELAFEGACPTEVAPFPRTGRFGGMIRIEVPFTDPADHFAREAVFRDWSAQDPVLGRMPLVFVLNPRATERLPSAPIREPADG